MRLGLRGKLVLTSVGLVLLCVLAADAFFSSGLDRALTGQARDELAARLALVALAAERVEAPLQQGAGWDRFADEMGRAARARVTVMTADGLVLGDSEVPVAGLQALDSHRDRPEVVGALARGSGSATRLSATLRERMTYVAVPFHRGGQVAGVVRAARPLEEVDAAVGALRRVLLGGSVLAVGLAVLVASLLAQRMARAALAITAAARRMAQGDLLARSRVTGADELGELGQTLDALAQGLASTLGELRRERDLLEGVLSAMREGVMLIDADGKVAMMNRALREMLLLDSSAVGKRPLEVIRRADLEAILDRARREKEAVLDEVDLPGLKPRRVLVHAMRRDLGAPALLVVLVDVTELRRLETLRRDFVANVSHELRTPIASVRSAAETLRSALQKDPVAARAFVEMVERNADRLHRLVEDLLDLSRIESRQYRLETETLDVGAALEQSLAPFADRAAQKRLRLEVERGGRPVLARADRRALEQVVSNLVDNAVKYCPPGVEIRARAAPEAGGLVRVTVEDDGPGIEARHLPRLFERFYRVDAGRSRELGGTGLGLSIVKHLVEAMGGAVDVTSTPGKGTAFSFTLPAA